MHDDSARTEGVSARMSQTLTGRVHRGICTILAFLLVLCGFTASCIDEALAEEPTVAQEEVASFTEAPCVSGQALACVASGSVNLVAGLSCPFGQQIDSIAAFITLLQTKKRWPARNRAGHRW